MKFVLFSFLFPIFIIIGGCSDFVDLADRVKASEEKIKSLEEKVSYLSDYIKELESIEELEKRKRDVSQSERSSVSSMFGRSVDEE